MLGNKRCERLMGPLVAFMFEDGIKVSSNLYNRVYEVVLLLGDGPARLLVKAIADELRALNDQGGESDE